MAQNLKSKTQTIRKLNILSSLFILLAWTTNTAVVAQTTATERNQTIQDQQNILKYIITKHTKDTQLEEIKQNVSEKGIEINFKKLNRNSKNELTSIKIEYNDKKQSGNHVLKSTLPIKPIALSINPSAGTLSIGNYNSKLSQTIIITSEDHESSSDKNIIFIKDEQGESNSQKTSPLIFFNGKEITNNQMNAINPEVIKSMTVLKGEKATEAYGEKGKDGAILIISKDNIILNEDAPDAKLENENNESGKENFFNLKDINEDSSDLLSNNNNTPLYFIDGKESSKEKLFALDVENIQSVTVLKDENAIKVYGDAGKNGVILVTTKKKN